MPRSAPFGGVLKLMKLLHVAHRESGGASLRGGVMPMAERVFPRR